MRVSFVEPLPHLRRLFASMVVAEADVDIEADVARGDAWVVSVEREPHAGPRPWRAPGAVVVWTTRSSDTLASRDIAPDAVVVARPFPAEALRRALRDARARVAVHGDDAAEPVGEPLASPHAPLPPATASSAASVARHTGAARSGATLSLLRKVPVPPPVPPAPPAVTSPVALAAPGSQPSDAVTTLVERGPLHRFSMALATAMGVPEAYEVVMEQVEEAQANAGVLLVHAPRKGDRRDEG